MVRIQINAEDFTEVERGRPAIGVMKEQRMQSAD